MAVARPSRRKKVGTDPNIVFASVEQIHQARMEAGRIESRSGSADQGDLVLCWVEWIATYGVEEHGCVREPRFAKWFMSDL